MFIYCMKKVGSILTLLLLLGAGMHLSIATHICSNQIAAVKVSFTGERVTCGMPQKSLEHSSTPSLVNDCCKDFLSAFSLSDKYTFSQFHLQKASHVIATILFPSNGLIFRCTSPIRQSLSESPPGNILNIGLRLAFFCILRR